MVSHDPLVMCRDLTIVRIYSSHFSVVGINSSLPTSVLLAHFGVVVVDCPLPSSIQAPRFGVVLGGSHSSNHGTSVMTLPNLPTTCDTLNDRRVTLCLRSLAVSLDRLFSPSRVLLHN